MSELEIEVNPALVIEHLPKFCAVGHSGEIKPSLHLPCGSVLDKEALDDIFMRTEFHPESQPLIIGVDTGILGRHRTNLFKQLFEEHNVDAAQIVSNSILMLYSVGKFSGLVLEGNDVTLGSGRVVPVYEGSVLKHGIIQKGISAANIISAVKKCDPDLSNLLLNNIVCSAALGENEENIKKIQDETLELAGTVSVSSVEPIVVAKSHAAWIGGSVLASLNVWKNMWVTSNQYYELGTKSVQYTCP
eukprot:GCRY01002697.1.p1 GENE.GCRY01002697.1~~GCRY01002697.1.p1  ORF type:complete len:246 (+),score=40.18 GCRY01002697.1:241-978(+)